MFEKIKQIRKLKKMQDALSKERATGEENGVSVIVNGKMEVEQVEINPDLSKQDQEKAIRKATNSAFQQIRTTIAQKMSQGGF